MSRLLTLLILLGGATENNPTLATNNRPKERTINVKVDDDGTTELEYGALVDERDGGMFYAFILESESVMTSFASSLLVKGYSVRCLKN